ncbi:hypothetical protein HMPREF9439_00532 [Parasutterella excrementihominis YIT 11859]|uniref:Uncharacterized protein n=1 Tax=Parasutterella excrementihominis YIT 11859 TaxID=762966 RepID=F3QHY5_9BURK|nr:hypothetical protein HMPREF9439_00532 [Parasutterella excrementihominis YIT 11859]
MLRYCLQPLNRMTTVFGLTKEGGFLRLLIIQNRSNNDSY